MKVKSIDFVARGKAELREIVIQETLAPNHVLLKTVCTLISPGTEFALCQFPAIQPCHVPQNQLI